MVIFFSMLLGIVSGGPSVPAPTGPTDAHDPFAQTAPTTQIVINVHQGQPAAIHDPFSAAARGPRVAVATPSAELHDPFRRATVAARFRNNQPATPSVLHDPFSAS